jgi:hypothetical protein
MNKQGPGGCNDGDGMCSDEGGGGGPVDNGGGGFCDASGNCGGISSPSCDAAGNCSSTVIAETGADPGGVPNSFGPGYLVGANSTAAWVQASEVAAQVNEAFANAYDSDDEQSCDQSSGSDAGAVIARQMRSGFGAHRKGQNSSSQGGRRAVVRNNSLSNHGSPSLPYCPKLPARRGISLTCGSSVSVLA